MNDDERTAAFGRRAAQQYAGALEALRTGDHSHLEGDPCVPQTDVQHVTVTLPMGVWLGVEDVLIIRRMTVRTWLFNHPNANELHRNRAESEIVELTRAIDAITDATASVGD